VSNVNGPDYSQNLSDLNAIRAKDAASQLGPGPPTSTGFDVGGTDTLRPGFGFGGGVAGQPGGIATDALSPDAGPGHITMPGPGAGQVMPWHVLMPGSDVAGGGPLPAFGDAGDPAFGVLNVWVKQLLDNGIRGDAEQEKDSQ
jgi:hypothetical protein